MARSGDMVLVILLLMLMLTLIGAYVFTSGASQADYSSKISGNESNQSVLDPGFLNRSKQKVIDEGPR